MSKSTTQKPKNNRRERRCFFFPGYINIWSENMTGVNDSRVIQNPQKKNHKRDQFVCLRWPNRKQEDNETQGQKKQPRSACLCLCSLWLVGRATHHTDTQAETHLFLASCTWVQLHLPITSSSSSSHIHISISSSSSSSWPLPRSPPSWPKPLSSWPWLLVSLFEQQLFAQP